MSSKRTEKGTASTNSAIVKYPIDSAANFPLDAAIRAAEK
jgi:hypothetical protein